VHAARTLAVTKRARWNVKRHLPVRHVCSKSVRWRRGRSPMH
jgi:hypothetical protein